MHFLHRHIRNIHDSVKRGAAGPNQTGGVVKHKRLVKNEPWFVVFKIVAGQQLH